MNDIRNHRDVRIRRHVHQLETRKLQNHTVLGADLGNLVQEGRPDIAARVHRMARLFQNLADERRRRRFPVASRHRVEGRRTNFCEQLNFGRELHPFFQFTEDGDCVKAHLRRTENEIKALELLQIIFPGDPMKMDAFIIEIILSFLEARIVGFQHIKDG